MSWATRAVRLWPRRTAWTMVILGLLVAAPGAVGQEPLEIEAVPERPHAGTAFVLEISAWSPSSPPWLQATSVDVEGDLIRIDSELEGGPLSAISPYSFTVVVPPVPAGEYRVEMWQTVDTLPAQLTVGFDQDVDASTINAMTITLERSGNDGTFADGNEVAVTASGVALSPMNARLAIVDLGGVASADDVYELAVLGSGPNVVLNLDAEALDGEFAGTFPSGDGNEGGDFNAQFTVQALQPTLASIQQEVFTPICAVCHTGPMSSGLPAGMDLTSAAASFDNLVGVASVQQPGIARVAPGDPDNSYLVQKLEGTAAVGSRMPQGGPFLDAGTIAVIRQWITDGANP